MKPYYFHTLLKALWDGQSKIKMYYECPGLKSNYREKGLLRFVYLRLPKRMLPV